MKLTKNEAIANHRKMWNWIAEETLKQKCKVDKQDYFETHEMTDIPFSYCYCCEYTIDIDYVDCSCCPIDWGGKYGTCNHRDTLGDFKGLYALWCDETDYIKAAELAKKIAGLPERK